MKLLMQKLIPVSLLTPLPNKTKAYKFIDDKDVHQYIFNKTIDNAMNLTPTKCVYPIIKTIES